MMNIEVVAGDSLSWYNCLALAVMLAPAVFSYYSESCLQIMATIWNLSQDGDC
jgi:hypothetical protein